MTLNSPKKGQENAVLDFLTFYSLPKIQQRFILGNENPIILTLTHNFRGH